MWQGNVSSTTLYVIFSSLFFFGFVLRFREFVAAGLSPEGLLQGVFIKCSEQIQFIEFQMKKSCAALLLHSLLPFVFMLGYVYFAIQVDMEYPSVQSLMDSVPQSASLLTLAIALPVSVAVLIYYWSLDNWSKHPFVAKLNLYAIDSSWRNVVGNINTEFRRVDKFTVEPSPTSKAVVTDNWIIYMGQWPWSFRIAHQSDVSTAIVDCDNHQISTDGQVGGTQFLLIEVQNRRFKEESFQFRLNALEYQNLTDKLQAPVENAKQIRIFKSVSDRFLDVFREEIKHNPKVELSDQEVDDCIGCLVKKANVKLIRRCERRNNNDNNCVDCFCRPMWCVDCLGRWFASRQNERDTETWLSSKCPCPTCRSRFCLLDVSFISNAPE